MSFWLFVSFLLCHLSFDLCFIVFSNFLLFIFCRIVLFSFYISVYLSFSLLNAKTRERLKKSIHIFYSLISTLFRIYFFLLPFSLLPFSPFCLFLIWLHLYPPFASLYRSVLADRYRAKGRDSKRSVWKSRRCDFFIHFLFLVFYLSFFCFCFSGRRKLGWCEGFSHVTLPPSLQREREDEIEEEREREKG